MRRTHVNPATEPVVADIVPADRESFEGLVVIGQERRGMVFLGRRLGLGGNLRAERVVAPRLLGDVDGTRVSRDGEGGGYDEDQNLR